MLDKFGAQVSGEEEAALSQTEESARRAIVAVLVSAAKSDNAFSKAEHDMIAGLVERKLKVPRSKVEPMISDAGANETLQHALEEIRDALSPNQRQELLALVWAIIGVDHEAMSGESSFAAKLRVDLGLSLEQALQARKISEGVVIDGFKEFLEASADVMQGTRGWTEKSKGK